MSYQWPDITDTPIVTAESLWKQYKVFGRVPGKWCVVVRNAAWLLVGANGLASWGVLLGWIERNPASAVGAGLWLPVVWVLLTWYVWHTKRRLAKVAQVMNVLERAA